MVDQRQAEILDKGYEVDWEAISKVQSQIPYRLSSTQQEELGKLSWDMRKKDSPSYNPTEQGMLEACVAWALEQS